MATIDKARQLAAYKRLATGLFVLMAIIYIASAWWAHRHGGAWLGYIKAFSEAAMVGALADWFAVTALFHHPLGLPIPHTNLIERGKQSIGSNLGAFVVSNFLTPAAIRPYISKLALSATAAEWLEKPASKSLLSKEIARLLTDILSKMNDDAVVKWIARKGRNALAEVKLAPLAGAALQYFLERGGHGEIITMLARKVRSFIAENEELVRERVKKESYFFIPSFVDNKLAQKITTGLSKYFGEIETDEQHRLRGEITAQLMSFAESLRTDTVWEERFRNAGTQLLSPQKAEEYAAAAWRSLKSTLQTELASERSAFSKYLGRTIADAARSLKDDAAMQQKIDGWIRHTAYRYILRNREQVGTLISGTVGAWPGRALSQKLELEVGKDLQYIRVNGTLVGGLVGLIIYALTEWIG